MSADREQELKELTAAYALGALDGEEKRVFEAWLATSPDAQREVDEYREVQALLALAPGNAPAASADLRTRVLEHATGRAVPPAPPAIGPRRPVSAWAPWMALAASLVAVAGLGLSRQQLATRLAERDSTVAALQQTLTARETRLAEREAIISTLLAPGVTLTTLVSTEPAQPTLQLFWNRRSNIAVAHASNLRPASAGRVYQLWFIPKGGKPIPSVTFNAETSGHALVQQISVPQGRGQLAAVAITDEPSGGSPQPTTTPFMVGTL